MIEITLQQMKKNVWAGCLLLAGGLSAGGAQAAILYGDFAGTTIDFLDVKEDDSGLFSTPTVSGDSLVFNPVAFEAQTSGGGIDLVDGTLGFIVMAKPGQVIDTLNIEEAGFYTLQGVGTSATQVLVALAATVQILEVDGVAFVGPSTMLNFSAPFVSENLAGGTALLQGWMGQADFDLAAAASLELGVTGDITKVAVTIDNQLVAISETGSVSFIDKKGFRSVIVTLPEPTTAVLLGLGTSLAAVRRRRG